MNTVQWFIDDNAARQLGKPFLITPETGTEMSYARLREHALDIGTRLDAMGIAKGEKSPFYCPTAIGQPLCSSA